MVTSPPSGPFRKLLEFSTPGLVGAMLVLGVFAGLNPARAQQERRHKIPVVDKIAGGSEHQAFSGTVERLDLHEHVLELNASESKSMEIFPVKKGVSVSTADGKKMKLAALVPGTTVMVYYDQKGERRTVRQIVVLAAAEAAKKKSSPHS